MLIRDIDPATDSTPHPLDKPTGGGIDACLVPLLDGRWFYELTCRCPAVATGITPTVENALRAGAAALSCRCDEWGGFDLQNSLSSRTSRRRLEAHGVTAPMVLAPYGQVALDEPGDPTTVTVDASLRQHGGGMWAGAAVTGAGWVGLAREDDLQPRNANYAELLAIQTGLAMMPPGVRVTMYSDNLAGVYLVNRLLRGASPSQLVKPWAPEALLVDIAALARDRAVTVVWRRRRSDAASVAADTIAKLASALEFDGAAMARYLTWVRTDSRTSYKVWPYANTSGRVLYLA